MGINKCDNCSWQYSRTHLGCYFCREKYRILAKVKQESKQGQPETKGGA